MTFADIQRPVRDPVVGQPKSLRRFRINPTDIDRFGATGGCPQCDHMIQYGEARRGITHSDPCRARISASLMATPDGRMRLEGHEERINRTIAQQIESQDMARDEGRDAEHRDPAERSSGNDGGLFQDWQPPALPSEYPGVEADAQHDDDDAQGGQQPGHGMDIDFMDEVASLAIFNCLAVDNRSFQRERKRAYRKVVSELYSPPRVTSALSCLPNASLVPGYALDLTVVDPYDGEP